MLFAVSLFLLTIYTVLIAYYRYHWHRVPDYVPEAMPTTGLVSVVVAARNEAPNLPVLLQALAGQTLAPDRFEVIIVDDYSTDNTSGVVQPFLNGRVQCIKPLVAPGLSSKKRAIEAGVARARGALVVVTDADCTPAPRWLELMLGAYQQMGAAFIVAPVQLVAARTSILGLFQQLDFMMLQGITAASVQAGAHSMCNGANLAYEAAAFRAVDGFAGVDARASGDDMLLLYKIWRRYPARVRYLKHPGAIMPTPVLGRWVDFFSQRIRWSSKATYYQDKRVSIVLFFVYGFNLWCLYLLVTAWLPGRLVPALALLAAKTGVELLLLVPVARFYGQSRLLWWFPLLQPLHIAYTIVIGLLSRKKTYQWKGRHTR